MEDEVFSLKMTKSCFSELRFMLPNPLASEHFAGPPRGMLPRYNTPFMQ